MDSLINNSELYQQIILTLPNYIFWKDTQLIYQGCNYKFAQAAGFDSPEQVIGKSDNEMQWGPYTSVIYQKEDIEIIETGKPIINKEVPMIVASGNTRILSVSKIPLYSPSKNIIGVLGMYEDVTEAKHNEQLKKEADEAKIKSLQISGAMIAHELRTPLAAINAAVSTLHELLPIVMQGYTLAKEADLPIADIHPIQYTGLLEASEDIKAIIKQANTVINMQLMNVSNKEWDIRAAETLSLSAIVDKALKRYPYNPKTLAQCIHFDNQVDFKFKGFEEIMLHIIFNLLKNALHFIRKARKGKIFITLHPDREFNYLSFKDTSTGIPEDVQAKLFTRFLTTETNGTGLGLAFCKKHMQDIGGDISCVSVYGEYTEFVLKFPRA